MRRGPRLFGVLLVVAALLWCSACKGGPRPKPDEKDERPEERPIEAKGEEAGVEFREAKEALEEGRWREAREAFRLVRAEHEADPIAELAELYVARVALRELEWPQDVGDAQAGEQGANGQADAGSAAYPAEARRILNSLAESRQVDQRVRRAAMVYRAAALARSGKTSEAWSSLATYPDAGLGSAVLERDRMLAWPILVEGLYRAERGRDAVVAAGRLQRQLEQRGEDERAGEQADAQRMPEARADALKRFARARAFSAADAMSVADLEALLEGIEESAEDEQGARDAEGGAQRFLRAVVGWAWTAETLREEELDEKQQETLDRRYREVSKALAAIGAQRRLGELSVMMATKGGAKRLAIGALVPLTGPNSGVGRRAMQGMVLAMEAFESRSSARVTLIFEDSAGKPGEVMESLEAQGVSAVVGPLDGGRAEAFAKLARDLEIPMITLTSKYPGGRAETAWVFNNFMDPAAEARAVADLAFEKYGDRRMAVVYPDIGYGDFLREVFVERVRQLGGRVVLEAGYDRERSDYSRVAGRVARAKPEAVFIPDTGKKVAELSAFLAEKNVWGAGETRPEDSKRQYVHYLGTSLWHDPILLRQAANYLERPLIPVWYAPVFNDEPTASFGRRFQATFGRGPEDIEAFGFDTVRWVRSMMIERGISRRESLRNALLGEADWRGATGRVEYNEEGQLVRTLRFVTAESGRFKALPYSVVPGDLEADSEEARSKKKGGAGESETRPGGDDQEGGVVPRRLPDGSDE